MAVVLTAGATCLDDLGLLTPLVATGLVTPIPSTATAHRRIHQLADSVDRVDDRMTRAMRTLRSRAWTALDDMNTTATMSRDTPLILDIDASLIHIHSTKQDAAPTYKHGFGFHPLCVFIDHGPGVGGVMRACGAEEYTSSHAIQQATGGERGRRR